MSTPVLGISYKFHVQYWTYSMNTPVLESSVTPCPTLDLFHEHPSTGKFIYSMSNTGLIPWKETNHIHQATRLWDLISSNTSVQKNYLKQSTPGPFRPWQATCTQNYIQNSFVYKYMKVSYRNNSPKSTNQHFNKSSSSKTLFNKML